MQLKDTELQSKQPYTHVYMWKLKLKSSARQGNELWKCNLLRNKRYATNTQNATTKTTTAKLKIANKLLSLFICFIETLMKIVDEVLTQNIKKSTHIYTLNYTNACRFSFVVRVNV